MQVHVVLEIDERSHQRFDVGEETTDLVSDRRLVREVHRDFLLGVQTEPQRLPVVNIDVLPHIFFNPLFLVELVVILGAADILALVVHKFHAVEGLDGIIVQKAAVHVGVPVCLAFHRSEEERDGH